MIAIYARQSLDKKDSVSIENQIDFCKREIQKNEGYKVYKDKGFSGKNTERPAFKELMADVKDDKITRLIVYRLDRISRSISDFANIIDILEEKKVSFTSTNEKFDTSTPIGRAMLYIIIVFAQMERETIAERIKDNYYSRGKTGVWLGGVAPFGFDNAKIKVDGKLKSTIETNSYASIAQKIFDDYAETDMSLGKIARELKEKYDLTFNNVRLSRMLRNPAYVKANADIYAYYTRNKYIVINDIDEFKGEKACILYGKQDRNLMKFNPADMQVLSIALHDGIVSSDIFLACQKKLESNKQIKNTGQGKHTWLTGLTKCGHCGYAMNVRIWKDTKNLYCRGKYNNKDCLPILPTYYLEEIEDYTVDQLENFVKKLKNSEIKENTKKTVDENQIKIELHKIEKEISNLIDNLSTANETLLKYANKKIEELDTRKHELLLKLEPTAKKTKIKLPDMPVKKLSFDEKRELAYNLISRVDIYQDSIKIQWKI